MFNKILKMTSIGLFSSILLFSPLQADYCCPQVFNSCEECVCADRFWVDAEYLYWKIKDTPEHVPLAIEGTTSPLVLGSSGSSVALGGKKMNNDWRSGGRFALGAWFDDSRRFGAEASYFFLADKTKKQSVSSTGKPGSDLLAIPFFNVLSGEEDAEIIANPSPLAEISAVTGKAQLRNRNRMQNAELNGLMTLSLGSSMGLCCDSPLNVYLLGGFRYWNFNESLSFTTSSTLLSFPEDILTIRNKFDVQNNFYGGQLGIVLDYTYNCFFVNVKGKVALGANCREVRIEGSTFTNDFNDTPFSGPAETFEEGIFALPTNIGKHRKTSFSVIPEVNINLGYQIMDSLRLQVGYTFLYVSKVARSGNQIDRNINPNLFLPTPVLVGELSPRPLDKTDSLWAQGVSAGFEFRF